MHRNYEGTMCYTRANRPAAMAQEQCKSQAIALALPHPQLLPLIASPSLLIIISSLALINSLVLILLGL